MVRLSTFIAVLLLFSLCAVPFSQTAAVATAVPLVFDYPVNGQTLDLEGAYLFAIKKPNPDRPYRWIFTENGYHIWDSLVDEHTLSTGEYGIHVATPQHDLFHEGMFSVTVSEWQRGNWTRTQTMTFNIKARLKVTVTPWLITPTPLAVTATPTFVAEATQRCDNSCVKTGIAAGEKFLVFLNQVNNKFDDSVFTGDYRTDPLGTLKGGELYTVQYDPQSKLWTTTGFNQETNGILTTTYSNADPAAFQISMWGWVFNISCNGEVFDSGYGVVGTIAFPDQGPR